ncbi:MAG TPA: HGxxPAAW family protein [Actinocrinis sp.]|nr:HGxxPAAW family protein [Actinocrinis sp.]
MSEAEVTETVQPHKGRTAVKQAAGMGMALMGSSLAGTTIRGEEHIDHGHAPARWAAVCISGFGWLIGGVAFPFGIWSLVWIGVALQVVAIVVNLSMNASGYGARSTSQWAQAKAAARAAQS